MAATPDDADNYTPPGIDQPKKPEGDQDDKLSEGKKLFGICQDVENDNRKSYKDDTNFVRARAQWPADIRAQREAEGRPCLTIDRLGPVIRQVVNDSRQNKPSIKVHPADSGADVKTAEVINGLIRNIEYTSNADVAYDTAVETAVGGNIGYIRVVLKYAYDDSFELDIGIERVPNPLAIYGDPYSTSASSDDWNTAFVVDKIPRDRFKASYPKAVATDWDADPWTNPGDWLDGDQVLIAEWWEREEYEKTIVMLSDGSVRDEDDLEDDEDLAALIASSVVSVALDQSGNPKKRVTKCYRVWQRIMTGAEILSEREWPGKYIPIIPVYGDEFWIEGKRYLRSLINGAKDAQMMLNFWRTSGTELVALAPKVPFIGPRGAFDKDPRWNTVNTKSHAYLEYEGGIPPQRQPLDTGAAAGALQEALNATDDIKAITGIYDASLGARSNETSGRAIIARQKEGDTSTFNFIDNLSRGIRQTGRVIIDLIPHVYTEERVVRVIGEDGSQEAKQVNKPYQAKDDNGQPLMKGPQGEMPMPPGAQVVPQQQGQPPAVVDQQGNKIGEAVMAMHDLTAGKYDLVVDTGPSYTTQRAETADQMMTLIQAYPDAAPVIGDILVKNLDWKGSDEIAERLKKLLPPQVQGQTQIPPEVQQQIEQGKQLIGQLQQENQQLKAGQQAKMAQTQADSQQKALDRESNTQEANNKILADERIANEKIASQERIAVAQMMSQQRIAALRPQPQQQPGTNQTQ